MADSANHVDAAQRSAKVAKQFKSLDALLQGSQETCSTWALPAPFLAILQTVTSLSPLHPVAHSRSLFAAPPLPVPSLFETFLQKGVSKRQE